MTRSEPHWLDLRPWPRVGYTLVEVTGSLGITTYPVLRDGLLKIATEAPEAVVVDIDGVEVLDSALLSVFTFVATRVGDWPGVPFSLVVSRPDHLALMHRRSIDRFVTVCETVDAARRSSTSRFATGQGCGCRMKRRPRPRRASSPRAGARSGTSPNSGTTHS